MTYMLSDICEISSPVSLCCLVQGLRNAAFIGAVVLHPTLTETLNRNETSVAFGLEEAVRRKRHQFASDAT